MNKYKHLKDKHQNECNSFPCFFAFNKKQVNEGMEKLGLNPDNTDKIYRGIGGMFYKKSDSQKLKDMLNRHDKELEEAIKNDKTGEGFIFDMFYYELSNHEYGYTYELDDTLDCLGLTLNDVMSRENLLNGLNKAKNMF